MVSLSGQLAAGASAAHVSADLVRDLRASAGTVGVLAFCTGATLYYLIFYRSQLIPRWLSVWGLAGTVLCLTVGLLVFFQSIAVLSGTQVVLSLPIAVQEMVLAVWLIVQGLSPKAKAPRLIDQFCFLPPIMRLSRVSLNSGGGPVDHQAALTF